MSQTSDKFKIGDTVSLLSDNYKMTVIEINEDGTRCVWLSVSKELQDAWFPPQALTKAYTGEMPLG